MDPEPLERRETGQDQAVTGEGREPPEGVAGHRGAEVPAVGGLGVTAVARREILDRDRRVRERAAKGVAKEGGGRRGGGGQDGSQTLRRWRGRRRQRA